jgi:site-specific DNA-methyltransferase (adenine-specific)
MNYQLHHGDCLEVLKTMADNSVDSIVTDPPYGLSFMGKKWDYDVPSEDVWRECLRVLKPGGHLLAFAGTRTQHRMAVRIEDAGFEIRDMIAWVYSTGFPKSLDVSKAIDKAAGAEREVIGIREDFAKRMSLSERPNTANAGGYVNPQTAGQITAPATDAAKQWQGWGTALKPALEPITVARKPFPGTVAANVLAHGTGGLNVDGCRVGTEATVTVRNGNSGAHGRYGKDDRVFSRENPPGRWPANLIHDGSDEVVGLFPVTKSSTARTADRGKRPGGFGNVGADKGDSRPCGEMYNDSGSAARFFYCAKASKADRDEGCEGMEEVQRGVGDVRPSGDFGERLGPREDGSERKPPTGRNHHPTVKPTDLMRYLCRLVTPPSGIVLDPFMGSGSTGKAAMLEGFEFIGIERDAEYAQIAKARIERDTAQKQLL